MRRRRLLQSFLATALYGSAILRAPALSARDRYAFGHGVASGDPLVDGVVLWTRVGGGHGERVRVTWQVAADPAMANMLQQGSVTTGPKRDYTVKVDVRGLPSGRTLYYRFMASGAASPTGRTRTLPSADTREAAFAVVSCSNYPAGYFHAYREIAARDDLDAVIHLGDYLYEYGPGEYATERAEVLDRMPDPPRETVTLADYRRRHALYKSDPDSQRMLARHPLIAVWDDHEFTNDAWRSGAENHNVGEGSWPLRRDAALRAFFEWMPVRGVPHGRRTRSYRGFRYGNLATLIMLDTRMTGRARQPDVGTNGDPDAVADALASGRRRLLGWRQEHWLRKMLERSAGTRWQILGQQVLMAPVRTPDLGPIVDPDGPTSVSRDALLAGIAASRDNPPLLLDTWDGYPAARETLLADLARYAENPVVLSGDMHTALAANIVPRGAAAPVAVELMTTSVSSPGYSDYLPEYEPGALARATMALNPHVRYMETRRRGWLRVHLTPAACTAEWHLLDTVHARTYTSRIDRRLRVHAGRIAAGLGAG